MGERESERAGESRDRTLVIGRDPEADVPLSHSEVSRRHAALHQEGDEFRLEDLGSANGTWVNGRRLEPHGPVLLAGGERVRLGSLELRFLDGRLVSSDSTAPREIALGERVMVGRGAGCDLMLADREASRQHCAVERDREGWLVRDLGSANGTWVNGLPVEGTARLRTGDVIRAGGTHLMLVEDRLRVCAAGAPVRLDARHLTQRVSRRGRSLTLLDDVSFTVYPNELVAIVGASGAGKTTLINALTGMKPAVEGEVFYNGVPFYENADLFRTVIGYVPQDDIVHRELGVWSVLSYAARLRLPDRSPAEIDALIDEVLTELDLQHRRDAVVSTLSGGERKRVNIAVELLTRPSLLLLDEPTSGLDPGLERRVVALVRRLTGEGRTVLFVTHATESMAQCDLVLFLSKGGRTAFYGPPEAALEFFGVSEYAGAYEKLAQAEEEGENPWPDRFRQSPYYRQYVEERRRELPPPAPPSRDEARAHPLAQLKVLTARYFEVLKGDPKNVAILLFQAPAIAFILSFLYPANTFSKDLPTTPGGIPPVKDGPELLFLMVVAALWFGTVNSAREVSKERAIFLRERLVNLRVWPYVGSKIGILSLLCLIQAVSLLVIIGARVELTQDGGVWWLMLLTLFLTSLAATLTGLALSSFASTEQSMSLVPLSVLPQVIFSGMLVDLDDMGPMRVIANLMPGRWAYGALGALADLPALFDAVGLSRTLKDVFHTNPAHAIVALALICLSCVVAAATALELRGRR